MHDLFGLVLGGAQSDDDGAGPATAGFPGDVSSGFSGGGGGYGWRPLQQEVASVGEDFVRTPIAGFPDALAAPPEDILSGETAFETATAADVFRDAFVDAGDAYNPPAYGALSGDGRPQFAADRLVGTLNDPFPEFGGRRILADIDRDGSDLHFADWVARFDDDRFVLPRSITNRR